LQIIFVEIAEASAQIRMNQDQSLGFLGHFKEWQKLGIVEIAASVVGDDLHRLEF
jgi:hypothetical protein